MLHTLSRLKGSGLRAKDGEIGSVEDFYFDDEAWAVRYLVLDTGQWLPGRKVLISPMSLGKVEWDGKAIEGNLTKEQVENSPGMDTHQPISRRYETELYDHYGYPYYWPGPYLWGPVPYPLPGPSKNETLDKELRAIQERERAKDRHLHSAGEVTGYYIETADGDLGHVEDFLVEDRSWAIRYLVVDTRNWWPGKKVVVSPRWIGGVNWQNSKVYIDLESEAIKQAPEYDPGAPIPRDYESRIHEHYGRPPYWDDGPGEPERTDRP